MSWITRQTILDFKSVHHTVAHSSCIHTVVHKDRHHEGVGVMPQHIILDAQSSIDAEPIFR